MGRDEWFCHWRVVVGGLVCPDELDGQMDLCWLLCSGTNVVDHSSRDLRRCAVPDGIFRFWIFFMVEGLGFWAMAGSSGTPIKRPKE